MKAKSIASVVLEYFQATDQKSATINDILKYYVEKYGKSNPTELQRARHAIYLKANRLVKTGQLVVKSKNGNNIVYACSKPIEKASQKKISPQTENIDVTEKEALLTRQSELEYELELCIAEAQGYEEMKSLLPLQLTLLTSKKNEAKKRAIQLNGLLTSTQKILSALSS